MKLVVSNGNAVLIEVDDFGVKLPEEEGERAVCMMMLSEVLVLLAREDGAGDIADDASDISASIRKDVFGVLRSYLEEPKSRH